MRSVIVGSGAASFPLDIGGALEDLVEAPDLAPIAARDPRDIVSSSLALLEKYELSDEARDDYLSWEDAGDGFSSLVSAGWAAATPTSEPVRIP